MSFPTEFREQMLTQRYSLAKQGRRYAKNERLNFNMECDQAATRGLADMLQASNDPRVNDALKVLLG